MFTSMHRPLTITIVFSVAAHAALLLSWVVHDATFTVASPETAPNQFHISLVDAVFQPPTPRKSEQPVVAVKQPPSVTPPADVAVPLPMQADQSPPADASPSLPSSAQVIDNTLRSKVLLQVQTHFSNYFYYPLLARRNGWQGHVLLGFAVEADGAITHTHIARGSGYAILDESALAALQQVQSLPHATHGLNGGRVELKLPVEYRLTGG